MKRLIEALKLVACPASAQRAALPSFVVTADEIALLFCDELRIAEAQGVSHTLAPEIQEQLRTIDRSLEEMSREKGLWSYEALEADPAWQRLRDLATAALLRLGEVPGPPDLSWLDYVEG